MAAGHRRLLPAALALAAALLLCPASPFAGEPGVPDGGLPPDLAAVDRAFAAWDGSALEGLAVSAATPGAAALARACGALLAGRLDEVEREAQAAGREGAPEVRRRAEWLADTSASWRGVLEGGEVVAEGTEVRLRVPREQVDWGRRIGPYAAGVVTRTRRVLGLPEAPPVEVVFLRDTEELARVAGIPAARLGRSGTVATTLYGRIFLLSPGAFPDGYAWHVVLGHEAVHETLHRRVPGKLPHGLEEGIATLLEEWGAYGRYRTLTPMERALLFLAGEEGFLLDGEKLDAPYWDLESELEARVAFLQALTGALVLLHKGPEQALVQFLDALAIEGAEWEGVVFELTRLRPASFAARTRSRWASMASREYMPSFLYSDGRDYLSEKGRRAVEQASKTVLLGDLLWGRGHREAARRMYARVAPELLPTPEMTWRLARLLLEEERAEEALEQVTAALERHPRDARVRYAAALVFQALCRAEESREQAMEAWLLNPFAEQTEQLVGKQPPALPGEIQESNR